MRTMQLPLCGMQDETRSSGKGLRGIAVLCCLLFAFVTPTLTLGQTVTPNPADGSYEWTWMGGHNKVASSGSWAGVYGKLGTPAAVNIPGSRQLAATWTDNSGNLWLFGGQGFDSKAVIGYLNDLWKFSPSLNEWTWMGGSATIICASNQCSSQFGVYPSQPGEAYAVPALSFPGGRDSASTWTDSSGNLWLFGGTGYDSAGNTGDLNDLWEYSPSLKEWRWMGGASTMACLKTSCGQEGVFPTSGYGGVGSPGGRRLATAWTDSGGNLLLFGGIGFGISGPASGVINDGDLDDLWEFNPLANQWTWIGGCNSEYSNSCQSSAGTYSGPQSRASAASWTDGNGNLWLFGGFGAKNLITFSTVDLNDLWEFNSASHTWIPITANQTGSGTYPAGRGYATGWTDSDGNLWLFGGAGFDAEDDNGQFNDLWMFNTASNAWTFEGGNSTVDNKGVSNGNAGLRDSSMTPFPGGHDSAASWKDSSGNFWLFGGYGYDINGGVGFLNDVWKYQPFATGAPPAAMPTFNPPAETFSAPITVTIGDATTSAAIYYTTDGTTPTAGSSVYSGPITVSSTETLKAIATANGDSNSAVAAATYAMAAAAPAPTFDPPAGSYNPPITVTISDAAAGAAIYYTTDGTPPASSPTANIYSGPISVSSTETLKAVATAGGDSDSAVAFATYSMAQPPPPSGLPTVTPGEWTWMGVAGSNSDNQNGVFTLPAGSFSVTNTPGGRIGAASWVSNGYLWLFGGYGFDANANRTVGYLDDLWGYDPLNPNAKDEWAWVAGQTASYTPPNFAAPPGGRYGASTWTDSNGNLWLYGGLGYSDILGDLWNFTPSTTATTAGGTWNLPFVTGTGSSPGNREYASSWVDHNGNFWLFGGYGSGSSSGSGYFNDLWEFNPNSNPITWSWKIASTIGHPLGAYNGPGNLGIPMVRSNAASWTDNSGKLWLFGGTYEDSQGTHYLNDMWMFDPISTTNGNQWTLVSSNVSRLSDAVDQRGACNTPETPSCIPGSRHSAATWTDSNGNLWLYGGIGYDAGTIPGNTGSLSDLWEFTPSLAPNGWQYIGGNALAGVSGTYGNVGWSGPTYNPGSRSGAVTWTDGGYLWLFGGDDGSGSFGALNDLWVYQPAAVPTGRTFRQQRPPAFTLGASSTSPIVTQGASSTDTITLTSLNGFTGNIALAVSGLPSGVTATFAPNPATVSSLLTLKASGAVPTGTYNIVVIASSGSMTATAPVPLTVNGLACHIGYTITTQWPSGFQAGITINNTGVTAITNWTLTWTFANGQKIAQLWDGNVTQSGANATVTNMSYNGSIPAGTSYTGVGFNGTWNNKTNAVPVSFAINGTACK